MYRFIGLFMAAALCVSLAVASPKGAKPVQDGSMACEFSLNDLSGKNFTLKDLRGKVVLLSFGASWCPYCVNEVPTLNKIESEIGGNANFKLLAVNLDSDIEKAKKFADKKQIKYTMLYDNGSSVAQQYGVSGIPANFVVGADGTAIAYGPDIEAAYDAVKKLVGGANMQAKAILRDVTSTEIGKDVVCPVMGTKFKVTKDTKAADYNGKSYYFCCGGCPEQFEKNPNKYAK